MGRSYWFECARCGYRAKVSGRADRGLDFFVQTIVCQECKELYDAVIRLRLPVESQIGFNHKPAGLRRSGVLNPLRVSAAPPTFQLVLNRLPFMGVRRFRWVQFKPQCPVSPLHRVQSWNDPDKCPRCGLHLEKNVLPYRIWE